MEDENEEHSEVVNKFKEVCAVDDDTALDFLRYSDWDLEIAVQQFFHSGGQLNVEELQQNLSNSEQELRHRLVRSRNSTSSSDNTHSSTENIQTSIVRNTGPRMLTWTDWCISLFKLPFDFLICSLLDLLRFLGSFIRSSPLAVTNPHNDVRNFIKDFTSICGSTECSIHWFDGTYEEALTECKNSLRFMIVYLHNPSHESSENFIRSILLSVQMKLLVERNRILMWGASVRSQEGYKVSMALRENTYPFIGLLCVRDNRMALVRRLEGDYELEVLLYNIQSCIDENRAYIDAARNERNQREADSRIRREQEAEYQRVLAADQARLDEQRRLASEAQAAQRKEAEDRRLEQQKIQKFATIRSEIVASLPKESTSPESIRVSIRFPCGGRFERRFDPDDSLEKLFESILADERCPMNFSLVSSYPRRQINCAPKWYEEYGTVSSDRGPVETFRNCGFERSSLVLVQDNDA